ncbi:AaceriAGR093Wp [[Ashbya] aceris (nom. inval.)]|nr:AaceriAGR093Wp [[Ashbya] aceris (nom. inval.)]
MNIASGADERGTSGHIEGRLLVVQQLVRSMLVRLRQQEDLYQLYTATKEQCLSFSQEDPGGGIDVDSMFELLMMRTPELLGLVSLPAMVRFFEWAQRTETIAAETKRAVITPTRCYNFLKEDVGTFAHGAEVVGGVFEALQLLQQLQMIVFREKPMLHDRNDPDSESPIWKPLDSPNTLQLLHSLVRDSAASSGKLSGLTHDDTALLSRDMLERSAAHAHGNYPQQEPQEPQDEEQDASQLPHSQSLGPESRSSTAPQASHLLPQQQHQQHHQEDSQLQQGNEQKPKAQQQADERRRDKEEQEQHQKPQQQQQQKSQKQHSQTSNTPLAKRTPPQPQDHQHQQNQQHQHQHQHQKRNRPQLHLPLQKSSTGNRQTVPLQQPQSASSTTPVQYYYPNYDSACSSPLFQQSIPDINQRIYHLTLENNKLKQQDTVLMQHINSLKQLVSSLQKTVTSMSLATGTTPVKGKVTKLKRSAATTPIRSTFINESNNSSMTSISGALNYSETNTANAADDELVDPLLENYEPFILKTEQRQQSRSANHEPSSSSQGMQSVLSFQNDPLFDIPRDDTSSLLSYQTVPVPDSSASYSSMLARPVGASVDISVKPSHVATLMSSSLQQSQVGSGLPGASLGGGFAVPKGTHICSGLGSQQATSKPKKPRPRYKESQGSKLSKGMQYQPPLTADGKNYLVDDEGKFSIIMSNDQDSIYSIYNEFYQSLKLQVEAFVQDFGKSKLVQFRKKRTFQKKKAFVYLVEKIAYFTKLSPEQVLDIVDNVRLKEEKSVVWVCNNLGALKSALVKYRPDLHDIIMSDPD